MFGGNLIRMEAFKGLALACARKAFKPYDLQWRLSSGLIPTKAAKNDKINVNLRIAHFTRSSQKVTKKRALHLDIMRYLFCLKQSFKLKDCNSIQQMPLATLYCNSTNTFVIEDELEQNSFLFSIVKW